MSLHADLEPRPPHPFAFLLLVTPFGVGSGFATVTLGYLLSQAGVGAEAVAAVVASYLLPQTWKFLWAPMVDTTLTLRKWYLIGVLATALGLVASGLVPPVAANLPLLNLLGLITSFATTLLSMAVAAMIPHHTCHEAKGRASGWYQAGNLGGGGIGGGAALWMAQHLSAPWMSALAMGALCLACAAPLLWLPPVVQAHHAGDRAASGAAAALRKLYGRMRETLRSLWRVGRSPRGFLGLLVVFLPVGTGAASNLWSAVADGWHASADVVALVNGALGGVVSMLGCLLAGPLCDRLERRHAYLLFALLQAGCAGAMALAPHSQASFVVFTLAYALLNGMCFTGFAAVALDCVESGATATQYNVFASLSNLPILYMGLAEGWAYARRGPGGMLWLEVLAALAGMVVFALAARIQDRRLALAAAIP